MFKFFLLLFSLCLTIFADQNNTLLDNLKLNDKILVHTVALSQFFQSLEENDSITDLALESYTDCYIEKMNQLNLNDLNTTNEQSVGNSIDKIFAVDYDCIRKVNKKYSLTLKGDEAFIKEIYKIIQQNLVYPKAAQKMRMTGTVDVGFIITKNGSAHALRINKSSYFDWLDNAALESVKKAAPFFPKPPRTLSLSISIKYELK